MASSQASSRPSQRRVLLWALPRTLSTALTKCMSSVDGVQIINEPFGCALEVGPEKCEDSDDYMVAVDKAYKELEGIDTPDHPLAFDDKLCTYEYVKKLLEKDYPNKKMVFCKDLSRHLDGKYDMIPEGYTHTFLIRDPVKVYNSWRNVLMNFIQPPEEKRPLWRITDLSFAMTKPNYQILADLYHHVRDNMCPRGSTPALIDADDLQNQPESILKQYCEAIEIPFDKAMLQWDPSPNVTLNWSSSRLVMHLNTVETRSGFFNKAIHSAGFLPAKAAPPRSSLTPDVIECVEASMDAYNFLYDLRIRP